MQFFPKKKKVFLNFHLAFSKFKFNFEHFQKKNNPQS